MRSSSLAESPRIGPTFPHVLIEANFFRPAWSSIIMSIIMAVTTCHHLSSRLSSRLSVTLTGMVSTVRRF